MNNAEFMIQSFRGGYDNNFSYLVTCKNTQTQFLVDAAIPIQEIVPYVSKNISFIFITHTHGDHIAYLNDVMDSYPEITVVIFHNSVNLINGGKTMGVEDKDTISVGNLLVEVIHTPGHYDDCLCFQLDNVLFTGDTLFVGRTGRTVNFKADTRKLYNSVYKKILSLSEETQIYPGHDYGPKPHCTLKENIEMSPLLCAEDEEDFVKRMEEYERNRVRGN